MWSTTAGVAVLVVSSTVYNEIGSEPTVIVVPVLDRLTDTGFGVDIGDDSWAMPALITVLSKSDLLELRRRIGVQSLTDVNNMLFKILATPETPRRG